MRIISNIKYESYQELIVEEKFLFWKKTKTYRKFGLTTVKRYLPETKEYIALGFNEFYEIFSLFEIEHAEK